MFMMPAKVKSVRALLVAAALSVGGLVVGSAEAQPFSFQLELPDVGGAASVGGGSPESNGVTGTGREAVQRDEAHCLSDREIRHGIERQGYNRVEINADLPQDRVEVVGQNGNWLYSMRVDKCSGEVDRVERIRRVRGGGFGLQFNFRD